VTDNYYRNQRSRRQSCNSGDSRDAIRDLEDTIRVLVDQNWRHTIFRRTKSPNLLVKLPRIGAGHSTRRKAKFPWVNLQDDLAHFSKLIQSNGNANLQVAAPSRMLTNLCRMLRSEDVIIARDQASGAGGIDSGWTQPRS
jgi:hypothetical protein